MISFSFVLLSVIMALTGANCVLGQLPPSTVPFLQPGGLGLGYSQLPYPYLGSFGGSLPLNSALMINPQLYIPPQHFGVPAHHPYNPSFLKTPMVDPALIPIIPGAVKPISSLESALIDLDQGNSGHSEKYYYGRSGLPVPTTDNNRQPTKDSSPVKKARYIPMLEYPQYQYQYPAPATLPYNQLAYPYQGLQYPILTPQNPSIIREPGVQLPTVTIPVKTDSNGIKKPPFTVQKPPHYEVYVYQ